MDDGKADYESVEELPPEEVRQVTGTVMQEPVRNGGYAADGGIIPAAAETFGQMLDLLEAGAFSHQVAAQAGALGREMRQMSEHKGEKVKGKITITLDMEAEGSTFQIRPEVKITAPKEKRLRSTLFIDSRDRFTRFAPDQVQMFSRS